MPSNFVLSPSAKAPSVGFTCKVDMVTPLIPARSVTSESITAPAAATFVASVTSALASKFNNFIRSALVIIAPEPALVISLRSAAAIDISALPSKLFPAIVLGVANLVAVAALPITSPVRLPMKPELAVIDVPVIAAGVDPPIIVPSIEPPVIIILSLVWVAISPSPKVVLCTDALASSKRFFPAVVSTYVAAVPSPVN